MNVLIVAPFFSIDPVKSRPGFLASILSAAGHQVHVVTSDFDHVLKVKIKSDEGVTTIKFLKTLPYKKNTSIVRFASHFLLAISFFLYAKKNIKSFDLVYITAPFALTALGLTFVCKEKVIIDIVDNWPDSLPFTNAIKKPMFLFFCAWKYLNKLASKRARSVISLSSVFLNEVGKYKEDSHILLGCKKQSRNIRFEEALNIFYIGNIGTLYDFGTLIDAVVLSGISATIHIVGDGDQRNSLLVEMKAKNVNYIYYGILYDHDAIKDVVDKCDVGFNGFSNTTASFSYKSLMYFSYSLPVINSMKGDLWDFVAKNGLGFNYIDKNVESLKKALISLDRADKFTLAQNVSEFFDAHLEMSVIETKLLKVLNC